MFFIGHPKNTPPKYSINGWVKKNSYHELTLIHALSTHRSIVSRYNGTSSGGECGNSSFRCNNPQQWTPGAYYPSNTAECTSNTPHHLHSHQHHYPPQVLPPQYNGYHHPQQSSNSNGNVANLPPHGRLQKSLSFAFTTPAMMNEALHPSCQNQLNSINYPERSYSRWVIAHMKIIFLFLLPLLSDRCDMYTSNSNNHHQHNHAMTTPYANGGLNSRSRSVPEGLAQPNGDINWNYNRNASLYRSQSRQQHMHILEQLTTTVWPKIHQNFALSVCILIIEGVFAFIS